MATDWQAPGALLACTGHKKKLSKGLAKSQLARIAGTFPATLLPAKYTWNLNPFGMSDQMLSRIGRISIIDLITSLLAMFPTKNP